MEIKEIIEKLDRIHNLLAKSDLTGMTYQEVSYTLIDMKDELRKQLIKNENELVQDEGTLQKLQTL